MTIRTKLYLSSLISVFLIVVFIFVIILSAEIIKSENEQRSASRNVLQGVGELDILAQQYLLSHENQTIAHWRLRYISLGKYLAKLSPDNEEFTLVNRLSKNYSAIDNIFLEFIANYEKKLKFLQEGSQEEILNVVNLDKEELTKFLSTSESMISDSSALAEKNVKDILDIESLSNNLTLSLGLILLINGAIMAMVVVRYLSKSLHALQSGASEIGKGNLNYKIAIKNNDELGQTAKAFNEMAGKLKTTIITKTSLEKEIEKRKKTEERLSMLNRILKALHKSSRAMTQANDELKYLNDVCQSIQKDCGYHMVWIGYAENDQNKSVIPVASAGFEKGYLEKLKITWKDTKEGQGPTGMAIRTGKVSMCCDILTDPNYGPWRKEALKRGYASSIAFPLITEEKIIGALSIYSKEPNPFSEDEIKLLSELSNDLTHGVMTFRLLNEREQTEKILHESEERFRAVADTAKDSIISANSRGEIIYFNKGAEKTFGYTASEILNKPITILMPNRFHGAHQHGFSRFLANRKPKVIGKTVELTGIRKNGIEFPIELSIANWSVKNDTYFTAIIRDITERKELEQRKDDFISIAGHELRTPVSAIKLMNQVLQGMLKDNPQALKYLEKIESQSSIQANLINDLLNVTKIQTGKLEIHKENVDFQDLVEGVAEIMQGTTQKHKIIIKGKIRNKIFTDKDRISQVLTNFCSNAIKFSPNGEKIIIELQENEKEIIVGVTDYGIGIPKKHHHGIFKRFYRVYGTGNKTFPGLGMGLYISYNIIRLLGGNMWFESAQKKEGSTFYFSLPVDNRN